VDSRVLELEQQALRLVNALSEVTDADEIS
jgi:hypothetical protein